MKKKIFWIKIPKLRFKKASTGFIYFKDEERGHCKGWDKHCLEVWFKTTTHAHVLEANPHHGRRLFLWAFIGSGASRILPELIAAKEFARFLSIAQFISKLHLILIFWSLHLLCFFIVASKCALEERKIFSDMKHESWNEGPQEQCVITC